MRGVWTADWNLQRYARFTELSQTFFRWECMVRVSMFPMSPISTKVTLCPTRVCHLLICQQVQDSLDGWHNSINVAEGIYYDILPATFAEFASPHFVARPTSPAWSNAGSGFPRW